MSMARSTHYSEWEISIATVAGRNGHIDIRAAVGSTVTGPIVQPASDNH